MSYNASAKCRPTVWDGVVAVVVLLLAAVIAVLVYGTAQQNSSLTVVVRLGGEVVDTIALSDFPDGAVTYSHNGYTLSVGLAVNDLIGGKEPGICVQHSNCPGGDCVRTGAITRAGQAIVCLPAQVAISLEGTAAPDAPDVIVG